MFCITNLSWFVVDVDVAISDVGDRGGGGDGGDGGGDSSGDGGGGGVFDDGSGGDDGGGDGGGVCDDGSGDGVDLGTFPGIVCIWSELFFIPKCSCLLFIFTCSSVLRYSLEFRIFCKHFHCTQIHHVG